MISGGADLRIRPAGPDAILGSIICFAGETCCTPRAVTRAAALPATPGLAA